MLCQRADLAQFRDVKLSFLLITFLVAGAISCASAESKLTQIAHGTVIDPATKKVISNATITIDGDQISRISTGDNKSDASGANVIDATGKFILPGYIDTHVHFFQSADIFTRPDVVDLTSVRSYAEEHAWIEKNLDDTFARYLRCGITSVVDVGGPMWNFKVRERANSTDESAARRGRGSAHLECGAAAAHLE